MPDQTVSPPDFMVTCKGSSRPRVKEFKPNPDHPDQLDLYLEFGTVLSSDAADYTVVLGSVEQEVVKVSGNVLTIALG